MPLFACGDGGNEPSDQLSQVGRYAYTYDGLDSFLDPMHFEGALVLTFVSEDSLAGRWEVPGYNPAVLDGINLSDHWHLMATSPAEGVASHQVARGDETLPVECEMLYNTGNGIRHIAGDCILTRE